MKEKRTDKGFYGKENKAFNEYCRKKVFVKKEMIDFCQSSEVKCSEFELVRRFKLVLAKKLAEKEGKFEPTTFSLYKNN